ncbi:MAG: hypothetical protein M0P15_04365 [Bacteroides sp.]|nr:hypothetical protein [Bacteroides sp.]
MKNLLTAKGICTKKTYTLLMSKYWADPKNGITTLDIKHSTTSAFTKMLDSLDIPYNLVNNNAKHASRWDKIYLKHESDVTKLYKLMFSFERQTKF